MAKAKKKPEADVQENDVLDEDMLAEIEELAAEVSGDAPEEDIDFDGDTEADIEAMDVSTVKSEVYEAAEVDESEEAEEVKTSKNAKRPKLQPVKLEEMIGETEAEALLGDLDLLAKKVGDKVVNAIDYVRGARTSLSKYTELAIKKLRDDGMITSSGLVDLYRGLGYKEGTCRSQGQQQMMALPYLTIAERNGNTLTFKSKSKMAQTLIGRLDGVINAPNAEPEPEPEAA